MPKISTSLEQSRKLIELGINTKTADLIYSSYGFDGPPTNGDDKLKTTFGDKDNHWYHLEFYEDFFNEDWAQQNKEHPNVPAWSLSALLSVIPHVVANHSLVIEKENKVYHIYYHDFSTGDVLHIYSMDDPIDAAFEMICWLKENKHM